MLSTVGLDRAAEQIGLAVWTLATGTASLPDRLTAAWVEHLVEVAVEDLPPGCGELWELLVAQISPDMLEGRAVEVAEELLMLLDEVTNGK